MSDSRKKEQRKQALLRMGINDKTLTTCSTCNNNNSVKRYKFRSRNGSWSVIDWCHYCVKVADRNIPRIPLSIATNFRSLPEFEESFRNEKPIIPCHVCGSFNNVEYHHWSPISIFGEEGYLWPGSYLCSDCHKRWHYIMKNRRNNYV